MLLNSKKAVIGSPWLVLLFTRKFLFAVFITQNSGFLNVALKLPPNLNFLRTEYPLSKTHVSIDCHSSEISDFSLPISQMKIRLISQFQKSLLFVHD